MSWFVVETATAVVGDGGSVMRSYMDPCGDVAGGGSAGGR